MAIDMKKMRALGPDELDAEAQALRDEIWKLRMQRSTGALQDYGKIRGKRHDLARLLTIKREQLAAATKP